MRRSNRSSKPSAKHLREVATASVRKSGVLLALVALLATFVVAPNIAVATEPTTPPTSTTVDKPAETDPAPSDPAPSDPAPSEDTPTPPAETPASGEDDGELEPSVPEQSPLLKALGVAAAPIVALSTTPGTSYIRADTKFYAYVGAGENIDILFTQAGGAGTVTITVRAPGAAARTCTKTAVDSTACSWPNLTSGTAGIWEIDFDAGGATSRNYDWTINVQNAANVTIPGRVYTERYTMSQFGPTMTGDIALWYQSEQGFQYRADYYDYNGADSTFASDATGVAGLDTCVSAYRSMDSGAPPLWPYGDAATLWLPPSGQCGDPYKIFFEAPSASLPATATMWNGTTEWLRPPVALPTLSNLAFTRDNSTTTAGEFTFDVTDFTGQLEVLIDANNDGDYTDAVDTKVPAAVTQDGTVTVDFDGRDGQGNLIPSTQPIGAKVAITQAGEIHFVNSDVETRTGLQVTALNGPDAGVADLYWNDIDLRVADRICVTSQVDGRAGVSSSGGVHGWPCGALGNFNDGIHGSWGDVREIDDWTYHAIDEFEEIDIAASVLDFGDAPNTYDTNLAADGARHFIVDGTHLGAAIDNEADGQPNAAATGDGADEDGVSFNPALGYPNPTIRTGVDPDSQQPIQNTLEVDASKDGFVSVWIDFNMDGDWDDAGERVANAQAVTAGSNDVTFAQGTNPPGIATYVRVRYSTDADSIATPTGAAPDGEVEDYRVLVERLIQPDTCTVTDTEYYAFTFGTPTNFTGTGGPGSTARYQNVTVVGGVAVDMFVQVISGDMREAGSGGAPPNGFWGAAPDDAAWQIDPAATLRYTFYEAGTTIPIDVNAVFTVDDMDADEKATFVAADLAGYAVTQGSTVAIIQSGGFTIFDGTSNGTSAITQRFQVVFEGTSTFQASWNGFAGSGFSFDGDGDKAIQPPACSDFGDAPNSYKTLLADDGPRHTLTSGLLMGSLIDFDPDGQPNAAAVGDDFNRLADEDGVTGGIVVTTGQRTEVSVSATNSTSAAATLVGWIDLNGDGSFSAGERVMIPVPANSGTADYVLDFPAGTVTSDTFARFRLFPGTPTDPQPTGAASAGEVEDYPVTVVSPKLEIEKTSNATADSRPGDTVTYTVTATNTGTGDFTAASPARVWDDMSAVLDDATYQGGAAADRGAAPVFQDPILSWTGALPAGETVTITYTVTLKGGGDGTVRNVAFAQCDPTDPDCDTTTPECNPPVGGIDPATGKACDEVEFELPKLSIVKAADRTDLPAVGETVTYTVTVKNEGPGDYTAARPGTITDDLTDVIDNTTDPTGITASVGTATFNSPELTWTGVLAAGESATITYEVTYTGGGDQQLTNNACVPVAEAQDPQDPCAVVEIPGSGLDKDKVASPASGTPVKVGEEVTYTVRFSNTGQTAATVDTFDDLAAVLDDADLVAGSITADTGLTAIFDAGTQRLNLAGSVPVGETLEVTYKVKVKAWSDQGNHVLRNALQCMAGDPPTCEPDSTEHPVRQLEIKKTSDRTTGTVVGDTVSYTVTAKNIGEADYTAADPAVVRDSLAGVLDDATYNGDLDADKPGITGYVAPILEWTGALAAGETVTLTYTVDLKAGGDLIVRNVAWGDGGSEPVCDPPTAEGNDPDTGQPCAEVEFGLPHIIDSKSVDPADGSTVVAGDELTYTLTFTNDGKAAGEVSKDDALGMLLDDAEIISGPTSSDASLTATLNGDLIEIRGTLAAGDTVTVTYTVKVKSDADRAADGGDDMLGNFLIESGTTPPTECLPEADEDSTCNPVPHIVDFKSVDPADRTTVEAGDELTYTLTFRNTGKAAGEVSKDDYIGMLMDDATAVAPGIVVSDPSLTAVRNGDVIEIRGTLAAGDTVTVTYTVEVKSDAQRAEDGGDDMLGNFLIEPGTTPPTECLPEEDEDSTCNPVPRITDTKSVDPADGSTVVAGDELTYTLTFTNDGKASGAVSKDDALGMLLDDAEIISGPTSSDPSLTAVRNGELIEIRGTVGAGETVTVTYTVKVKSDAQRAEDGGDDMLGNFLIESGTTPPTECLPEEDEDSTCNPVPRILDSKSVDPADRTTVVAGDELTYTLTFTNDGKASGEVSKDDYIGMLMDDATAVAPGIVVSDPSLTAVRNGDVIEIRGTLAAGESVTVTYTVEVKSDAQRAEDGGDDMLGNFLIEPGTTPPTECLPEEDEDSTCNPVPRITDTKSVDPADGSTVVAGDELTYTLTFTNDGKAAGEVSKDDALGMLLDDAEIISGPTSSDPSLTAVRNGELIEIRGTLAAGDTVTVTYTVKVKSDADRAADGGDDMLGNFLIESGTTPPTECLPEADEDSTCNPVPRITDTKSVDPADGSTVVAGDELTYTLTFTNDGKAAGEVSKDDALGMLLDDAEIISGPTSSDASLTATLDGNLIKVRGTLAAGDTVTVTYTVKVKSDAQRVADHGDDMLGNFLIESGTTPPMECLPEEDEDSTCNPVPRIVDWKSVAPASQTPVVAGQVLTYTLTFANRGQASGDVDKVDDLTHILDDADVVTEPTASDPALTVTRDGKTIAITGELAKGQTVTVTYTVKVKADAARGDDILGNFLIEPGETPPEDPNDCVPAEGEDADCTTNPVGAIIPSKSVDPKSGTTVKGGQVLTYTLSFENPGKGAAKLDYTDHMAGVLDDAELVGTPKASAGVTVSGPTGGKLHITGEVPAGATATVTYRVKVKDHSDQGDHHLGNFVTMTGEQPPTECVPANPLCTENPTAETESGGDWLPDTGGSPLALLGLAGVLMAGGTAFLIGGRRRTARSGGRRIA